MGCLGGGDITVTTPAPSETELEIQKQILELLQQSREKTPLDEKMEEYSMQLLEDQISALPLTQEQRQMAYELAKAQYEEYFSPEGQAKRELESQLIQWQLEGVKAAREMGAITGDLSEQEMDALNTLEANAIQTLEETVGRSEDKIMASTISEMVNRGMLQGDVGAQAMAEVGKRSQELIAEGTRDIESQKMSSILNIGEAQKNRQLAVQQMLQQGILTRDQADQLLAMNALNYAGGQQNIAQQFAQTAQQFGAGLEQDWLQSQLTGSLNAWGQMMNFRGTQANQALQAAIANQQSDTSRFGSLMGAIGTGGGIWAGLASQKPTTG